MKKKTISLLGVAAFIACASFVAPKKITVIHAQSLPYNLVVTWDASPEAQFYSCYLDGVKVIGAVTALTCSFPVSAAGNHIVGVTASNTNFIPNESVPATLAFKLQAPANPANVRVR